MKGTCKVEGCDKQRYANGACCAHNARFKKRGSYDLPPRQVDLPCKVPTCDRNAKAIGLCGGHWKRWYDYGDVREHIPLKRQHTNRGPCSVDDCERRATAVGMCPTHRGRVRKFGDAMADVPLMYQTPTAGQVCSIEGCERPSRSRGWCSPHYLRWFSHGDTREEVAVRHVRKAPEPCSIASCDRVQATHGWCKGHYARWLKYGDARPDEPFRPIDPSATCKLNGCGEPHVAQGLCYSHYGQQWRAANAEKLRDAQQRRRIRKAGNLSLPISPEDLAAKVAYWGSQCWICRGPYESIDHVKPIDAGGAHILSNMRPCCIRCNSSKGHKWPYPTGRSAA